VNGGGLEHQSSQVDEVLTSQLDANLSGLYSHEAFHAWNVKRLRPADMVPYRYDDAQPTTWLWVSEGVTDYYGELGTIRGGINDSTAFFNGIGGFIAQTASAPPTAVSDASLSPWIAPTDGSSGLYYPKGALIGFLLDIMIRDASDNRSSLDHVMRTLYNDTWKHGRGFTSSEWWREVGRAAGGKSFTEFARKYVDGREPLPTDSVMRLAGLQSSSESIRELRLGISTETAASGVAVTVLSPGGAAAASGLRVGDRIVSIGDVAVTNDDSFGVVREHYVGTALTTLPMVVRRGAETVTLQLPVRLFPRTITRVSPIPGASEKAVRIRNGIMKGTTS
jgi:predicted metalloprotease with PDZ domain